MIAMNPQMQQFFINKSKVDVPSELKKVIEKGFFEKKEAVIFSAFKELMHIKLVDPEDTFDIHKDLTGFECFANKIFLDDYIEDKTILTLPYLANLSFRFADLFVKKWNAFRSEKCLLIMSLEENLEFGNSARFRFHIVRENEFLFEYTTINDFNQPIMICDNTSSVF